MKRFSRIMSALTVCVLSAVPVAAQFPSSADVGDVGQPGHSEQSNAQATVTGAGEDIWSTADAFHFRYGTLPGTSDIEMVAARLLSQTALASFAKAGIMIRQALDPSAPHVVLDVRPGGEVEFMTRDTPGGPTRFLGGITVTFPITLVLQRQTGAVRAWVIRENAIQADDLGSTPFFRGPLLAGLVANSHSRDELNMAEFDRLGISPGGRWNFRDVGDVGLRGGSSGGTDFRTDSFEIRGAGDDIWGTADAFHFAYKESHGDVEIVGRVRDQSATDPFAKAGVMMRVPTAASGEPGPGDTHVILDIRPDGNLEFMTRREASGETTFLAGGAAAYPVWLRLVRTGDRFEGFTSSDGANWSSVGATTLAGPAQIDTGLAVTSHDRDVLNLVHIDSIVVTAGAPPPRDIVIYASDIPGDGLHGSWTRLDDSASPNGTKLVAPDVGAPVEAAGRSPHFVEATFDAPAGVPYTIWLRLQAQDDDKFNDSVWVQFSDAVVEGQSVYRIGSTDEADSALLVNLATDGSASSLNAWGWQQTAYWLSQPTTVSFASSGAHTIRLLVREDGVQFDQIVLSPSRYLHSAPGPATNDGTIVPKQ